jgi:S1-C subfamily serine protease
MARVLRSHRRHEQADVLEKLSPVPDRSTFRLKRQYPTPIEILPNILTAAKTGLSRKELATLNSKRQKLLSSPSQASNSITKLVKRTKHMTAAARATLVFAQHEAGTAVCIAASGLVLTCAHCVAESPDEYAAARPTWLVFSSGQVVRAECVAWDQKRDLALLRITAADRLADEPSPAPPMLFSFAEIASQASLFAPGDKQTTRLICIGHPGSEDLEAVPTSDNSKPILTDYDVLHVSRGYYHGLASDQDVQDNSEIGALQHDCWTYWGHSGAPLIDAKSGEVVGLHSSWDDETGMRRGIAWEALHEFMEEWCEKV